jgi:hypothetical protein
MKAWGAAHDGPQQEYNPAAAQRSRALSCAVDVLPRGWGSCSLPCVACGGAFFLFPVAPIGHGAGCDLPLRRKTVALASTRTISVDDLRAQPAPHPCPPRLVRPPNAEPIPGPRLLVPPGSDRSEAVGPREAPAGLFQVLTLDPGLPTRRDSTLPRQELLARPRVQPNPSPCRDSLPRVELVDAD